MESHNIVKTILDLIENPNIERTSALDNDLDDFFQLDIKNTENIIKNLDESAYVGLDPRALLTSYVDYYQILKSIEINETLVDLGAGYSRGSIISQFLKLGSCISLEYVKQRVLSAQNSLELINGDISSIRCVDLREASIPDEKYYFLYFPKGPVLYKILMSLFELAKTSPRYLFVCESHGDVMEYLDMFSNIEKVAAMDVSQPRHKNEIVKYKITPLPKELNYKEYLAEFLLCHSKENLFLVIDCSFHNFDGPIKWYVPIGEVELIIHNAKQCLYYKDSRIIELDGEESLSKIISDEKISEYYKSQKSFKKLFSHVNSFYIESNNSEIMKVN